MKSTIRAVAIAAQQRVCLRWMGSLVVAALGARTLLLAVGYLRAAGAPRFQVESAATLFIFAGLALRMARMKRGGSRDEGSSPQPAAWTLGLWWGIALILYWPSLGIGFLSDDFVLADRAVHWRVGPVTPELFRPLPLLIWGCLLRAGGGPLAIHVLNVLLHGANAYLTTLVVEEHVRNRASAILAGFVVVAFPLGPEAVAWASGMFDVMATCFILTLVLLGRACADSPSGGRRIAFFACGVAALFSKETAAIAPLLVLLDLWATRRLRWRGVTLDTLLLMMATATVGGFRLAAASSTLTRPITKYVVQRWIFGTFGSAALPWRADVISRITWLPTLGAIACLALLLSFFLWGAGTRRTRIGLSNAAWMLVATLPVMTAIGVAPDLQGARYQYLSSIGWAGLLAAFASAEGEPRDRRFRFLGLVALAGLVVTYVPGLRWHLSAWRAAAAARQAVEQAAQEDPRLVACGVVTINGLPDNVEGAYVFRNGALEAFARDVGVRVSPASAAECSFVWNGSGFTHHEPGPPR